MDATALLPAVGAYVHALCKTIWACRQLEGVARLLEAAVATLMDCSEGNANILGAAEGLEEQWRHLQAAAAAAGGRQLITPCFYGLPFRELGETLLSGRHRVVSGDLAPEHQLRACAGVPAASATNERRQIPQVHTP